MNSKFKKMTSEKDIDEFINSNENALEILDRLKPLLVQHFPESEFSLKLCDDLTWTTEEKLLINVSISEETFFNDVLTHFNELYAEIEDLTEDILCPVVLFPQLSNERYDKRGHNSAINVIARQSYFNNSFDKNLQREMTLRDIPKSQKEKEIIEYCQKHPHPDLSDVVFDLQLDLFDVDEIVDELDLDVRF